MYLGSAIGTPKNQIAERHSKNIHNSKRRQNNELNRQPSLSQPPLLRAHRRISWMSPEVQPNQFHMRKAAPKGRPFLYPPRHHCPAGQGTWKTPVIPPVTTVDRQGGIPGKPTGHLMLCKGDFLCVNLPKPNTIISSVGRRNATGRKASPVPSPVPATPRAALPNCRGRG